MLDGKWLQRAQIERHSADLRQFMDFRQVTLVDGSRLIEAYNSSGLTFSILPDRGLDMWLAHYKGIPLTWISQGSPRAPDFGQTWLQQFNGGLLTTCGLMHVGPPETDSETGEFRDLHGRYSRLPAHDVYIQRTWEDKTYAVTLTGTIPQVALHGEQLLMERSYRLVLGEPAVHVSDKVTNLADTDVPLMILYHFNFGYPLVCAGAQLSTASEVIYARDATAQAGFSQQSVYNEAAANYAEQVFFHVVKADAEGNSRCFIGHEDLGVEIEWQTQTMPFLTQWKNTRYKSYVCGIEPGNCIPEGQSTAKANGRLEMLEPGTSREFACTISVLNGAWVVKDCRQRIADLRRGGELTTSHRLDNYIGSEVT